MSERRDGPLALCLFALLFSVYLLTFSGRYHSSDEMSMLVATDSLARRGVWDIELLRWMGEQQGSFGPDGHLYSRKGIGTTLAALPLYWLAVQAEQIGNVQAAMLTNGLVTALTGVLVFLFLRRLRYGAGVSLGAALAFGLATMAWPYARYLFSESLAGLGLLACAYFLLRFRDKLDRASLLLAGAGLGVALLARLNNAIVAPFLGLLLLVYLKTFSPSPQPSPPEGEGANSPPLGEGPGEGEDVARGKNSPSPQPSPPEGEGAAPLPWGRGWGRGRLALGAQFLQPVILFALPVLAALAVTGWYNWLRFGDPLATGYLPEENFSTPFFQGLYGLTFSPGKGLFWYNPLLFAALIAWPAFWRKHRAEAPLVAAVVLGNIAFYAPWYLWWAGHAWGPRFLVTILPFAVLPLAPALEAARRRRALAWGLGLLALASVAVQLLGVAVDFNLYLEDVYSELGLYHPATLFNPFYSPLLRQWAYLRPENLDLAWARMAASDKQQAASLALVGSVALVLLAGLALWATWRGRLGKVLAGLLVGLLAFGACVLLLFYAPSGDVAEAAAALARMERPGDAAALTDPFLTEAWQDAYDGKLWVWGVPSKEQVDAGQTSTWVIGAGDPDPAAVRFQVGTVRLDYYPPPGERFETTRLPAGPVEEPAHLGEKVELAAILIEKREVRRGDTLWLRVFWRTLAPMDTSYTLFVQLVDRDGVKAAQIDHLPCNGACPTTTWRVGDIVGADYDLPVRADAPPGLYELVVGMYDLDTGENLTSQDGQPYLILDSLQVTP
jgi:hypothetical protein